MLIVRPGWRLEGDPTHPFGGALSSLWGCEIFWVGTVAYTIRTLKARTPNPKLEPDKAE